MLTRQLIRDIFFKEDQNNSQKNYVWNDSIKDESLESHIPSNGELATSGKENGIRR